MEVKLRSSEVKCGTTMRYGYQTWSKESLMQVFNDDDICGDQRSSEIKCGNLCIMATTVGQMYR